MEERPTYLNPVYRQACPDPFVLKHRGEYWCYHSGVWSDGNCFGALHSTDLVHWEALGGVMPPPEENFIQYRSPEVIGINGRFYLFYSAGDGQEMHIRAAMADYPSGPFVDSGKRLTSEAYAVDPHVFTDTDGTRYLFYAASLEARGQAGLGIFKDRLSDPFHLEGQPNLVIRGRYRWQKLNPDPDEAARWPSVEGPFALQHKGKDYLIFSGESWKDTPYGICYAIGQLQEEAEWTQAAEGIEVPSMLGNLPEYDVVGPGQSSVVRGPNNLQAFCVYHRWEPPGLPKGEIPSAEQAGEAAPERMLAIDRLEFIGERLALLGPSFDPQPAPLQPTLSYFHSTDENTAEGLGNGWRCVSGMWALRDGMAIQSAPQPGRLSEASLALPCPNFVLEVSLKAMTTEFRSPGGFGLILDGQEDEELRLTLLPRTAMEGSATAMMSTGSGEGRKERPLELREELDPRVWRLLRVEVNNREVKLALDGGVGRWQGLLGSPPTHLCLFTLGLPAAYCGFELTCGWEDHFEGSSKQPETMGWQPWGQEQGWEIREGALRCDNPQDEPASLYKGTPMEAYELVVNARLEPGEEDGAYGVYPAFNPEAPGPLFQVERKGDGWALMVQGEAGGKGFPLPGSFDPYAYQQFRFVKGNGHISVQWEAQPLGEIAFPERLTCVGLGCREARAAFDLVRLLEIR